MILAFLLGQALAAPAPQAAGCPAIRAVVPAGRVCVDARNGVVIATTQARGEELATLAAQGEQRFALRFGRGVPRYAIMETADGSLDTKLDAALKQGGYLWRLPWLTPEAMVNGYRESIARSVRAQALAKNLGAADAEALVDAALAQQASRFSPEALRAREAGTLPHELGHGWFIHAFWPSASAVSGDHYGGPAPDWLDESAAVLMEDDGLADRRRQQFAAAYRGPDAAPRTRLVDLTEFLSGGHPALPKLDLPAGTGGVKVLTGDEAARIAAAAGGFYLQARLFADYLIDRSGDPAIFQSLALAFAEGKTLAQWLATEGTKRGLPGDMAALQRDWEGWLAARFAAAAGWPADQLCRKCITSPSLTT